MRRASSASSVCLSRSMDFCSASSAFASFERLAWSSVNAGWRPKSSKWLLLDVKAFPAAALVLDIGVAELEAFVEALARVVELGALEVWEALRVDDDRHAVALELHVLGVHRVGEFQLVGHARAAGSTHANAQPYALAALGEVVLDVLRSGFCERDHATFCSSAVAFSFLAASPCFFW